MCILLFCLPWISIIPSTGDAQRPFIFAHSGHQSEQSPHQLCCDAIVVPSPCLGRWTSLPGHTKYRAIVNTLLLILFTGIWSSLFRLLPIFKGGRSCDRHSSCVGITMAGTVVRIMTEIWSTARFNAGWSQCLGRFLFCGPFFNGSCITACPMWCIRLTQDLCRAEMPGDFVSSNSLDEVFSQLFIIIIQILSEFEIKFKYLFLFDILQLPQNSICFKNLTMLKILVVHY